MRYEIQTTEGIVYLTEVADVYDYAEGIATKSDADWFDIDGTQILGYVDGGRSIVLGTVTIVDYFA